MKATARCAECSGDVEVEVDIAVTNGGGNVIAVDAEPAPGAVERAMAEHVCRSERRAAGSDVELTSLASDNLEIR